MAGKETDHREQATNEEENSQVSNVPSGGSLDELNKITGGSGFGDGNLDFLPDENRNGRGALGTNIAQLGDADENVVALQTYMAGELDPDWDGNEAGNTPVLPDFGIDGVWRCETQGAFNMLLEKKGIKCNDSDNNECGEGVPSCVLDEQTLNSLKRSEVLETEPVKSSEEKIDDQCFLINNLQAVFNRSKPPMPGASFHEHGDETLLNSRSDIKYKKIHKISTNNPGTLMNRLRLTKGLNQFLNIKHYELSQLTPTVRLYKQYYETPKAPPKEVEFEFSSFVDPVKDLQSMLNSTLQRGVGVGIESFNFSFVGVQPATAKADIKAQLVIHAQNFNELFKKRPGLDQNGVPLKGGYRIIDLVLLEPKYRYVNEKGNTRKTNEFNPNFYEIKAVAGWAATGGGGVLSDDLSSAIKDNQVEMFLTTTNHKFDFKDDGSVRLILDFRARIETIMMDPKRADVLFDPPTIAKRDERINKINEITSKRTLMNEEKIKCEDDSIKELRQLYEQTIEKEREDSYLSILKQLIFEGCIYTAKLTTPTEADKTFAMLDGEEPPQITFVVENVSCDDEIDIDVESFLLEPGVRKINFFYLGDLYALVVNNVLENMQNFTTNTRNINFGNIRFMLGPAVFDGTNILDKSGNKISLNIADIPISVELFTDFMRDEVIRGRKNTFPLLHFMRSVMKKLMYEALGPECGSGDRRAAFLAGSAIISADSSFGGSDPIAAKMGDNSSLNIDEYGKNLLIPSETSDGLFGNRKAKNKGKTKFVFDSFNKKSLDRSFEYFVIYNVEAGRLDLSFEKGEFDSRYERDLTNGILHTATGLDRGLVKSMTFTATTQKHLRELRYLMSDFDPELQLSNVYECDLRMYGNNLFAPGCRLFINPRGLGSDELGDPGKDGSNANTMGLGGYHNVITVKHSITPSEYITTLRCRWESSGDGLGSFVDKLTRSGDVAIPECADLEREVQNLRNDLRGDLGLPEISKTSQPGAE